MRVNSSFTNFLKNQLIMRSGRPIAIGIIMLAIFFIASSFTKHSDRDILQAKQANLIVREIGHRLLLQAGDYTSRVLPVTEIKEGTFLLAFENEFVFNHDSLMVLTQRLLPETQFPSGYTVTVHECVNADIVYGFQINSTTPNVLPCSGRSQPRGCYSIEIALTDLYKDELKKVIIKQQTDELISSNIDTDAKYKHEELNTHSMDILEVNPTPEEVKTATFDYPFINLVYGSGLLVLLGVAFLIGRFGKSLVPVVVNNQNHTITKEFIPELPVLGKFLFDVKDQRLLLGTEMISLTDKECKVLELLNNNFGELITRETLMHKICISEGVITGRSLDMFVSKLRKKLSGDPDLRITNVHGKGYKLEIQGVQSL